MVIPEGGQVRLTTRMVANDLIGITRDDLAYDVGRHVDDSVHLFENEICQSGSNQAGAVGRVA